MTSSVKRFFRRHIILPGVVSILIVVLTCSAYADIVFLRTGGFWQGTVRRSTGDSIRLFLLGGNLDIASAEIDSIRFNASDTITLRNGEQFGGKVCCTMNDSLSIATGEGPRMIARNTVGTVIRNSGGPLTVPSLPETNHQFAPSDEGVIGDHPRGMVFRLNGSLFVPFISNEDAGFRFANTDGRPDRQYCYGAGLGITALEPLTLLVQYERFATGSRSGTSSGKAGSNEAMYDFVYGSLEFQYRTVPQSNWSYSLAIDLGIMTGTEKNNPVTGGEWVVTETIYIVRPRFEIEYAFPHSNFALRSGVGYLTPVGNVIRFTGTTLNTSLLFRLPFVGGPI